MFFPTVLKQVGWYRISYIYDYIVLVVLILILGILSLSVEPYRRAVPNASENVNVLYPALDNTIPSYAAVLLAYGQILSIYTC